MLPFILWLILRLITSTFAGMVSSIKPYTPQELSIPLLPPSLPLIQWIERVFISPWIRWDALWYQKIVTNGYSASDGTAQFHPLYPWLATPLALIGVSSSLSLLLISSLAGIALYYLFYKLAKFDLDSKDATFALMLFAFSPPAFILFAPYSESLFLLTAVACFIFIRQKSWWLAALMGGLATLTRQQGIFLFIPIAWELWENSGRVFAEARKHWKDWLALSLIPAGLLVWLIYRAFFLNDLHANYSSPQQILYSILISPSAVKVVPVQQFIFPWLAIRNTISKLNTNSDVDIWVNIIVAMLFLILLIISWKKMRMSYRLYSATIFIISFCYYTGSIHPYMGLPRHLLIAFPIFIGSALVITKPWMRLVAFSLCAAMMFFLIGLYVLNAWVP
jgi:Gpi18-like mannosyltransferase